ncbi:hypothetical protein KC318_g3545 [Hortaea werneckii]|nr:hypothetical protein KC334_g3788 [Hortaea werneckii]KAI7017885.1 hypothetical protein KC355_g3527 [Hortaea werneckii]KAI7671351.1 hypothetical protein KC318_g3545 [Hortaea werneckii]
MAATTSLVPTCASCIFGAVSTSVLSYTAHVIKTIEVDVTPHVFTYLNGTRETTSLESNTHTEAIAIPTGNATESVETSQTFSDIRNVTWTVGDATLTYPTSYVQYLAFAGAAAINTDEPACAEQTDATNVQLPSTTDAVYSTLQPTPVERTDLDASTASIETLLPKRYEGPRGKQHQGPIVTLSPDAKNDTQGIGRRQNLSGSGFATGTGTEGFATPGHPEESTESVGSRTTLAYSSVAATNVHTTAFVIAPITGRDIVTSESPSPGPTTHGGNTDKATALPANNGSGDDKPNENEEHGSSSGNGDSSTNGEDNGGASGDNDGSDSSEQTGGSGNGGSGQDSRHSDDVSHDGNSDEESSGDSAGHSGSDGSGSNENSGDDAGSHSGGQSATTGNESGEETGEQSGTNDASNNSSGSGDAQGQSHDDSSSHNDSEDGGSEGSQAGGDSSQNQSGDGTRSSVSNGDASQTSGSNNGDNAGDEADISNLLGGIASAASDLDQTGDVANTAQVQAAQATFAANGNTYTVVKQGEAVVAEGASATLTVSVGSGTVFEGQTISAASDGNVAINGQQQTFTSPGTSPSYGQTTLTEAGKTFTASQAEGTAIVLNEGGSSMTIQGAEQTRFAGETVSVQSNGNAFVLGSRTISFNAAASTSASAVFTAGTHTITALQTGDSVILQDSTSTMSVSDGVETTFEGQEVSVASNGQSILFGSQTITLDSIVTPAPNGQAVFTVDDHTITAKQSGDSVIIQDQSSTITVQDGATTRFEGEDLSIASDGRSVVIDGTSTVLLTKTTPASSTGMGGYINSGLSPGASATDGTQSSPSSTSTVTSGSGGLRSGGSFVIAVLGLCGIALM